MVSGTSLTPAHSGTLFSFGCGRPGVSQFINRCFILVCPRVGGRVSNNRPPALYRMRVKTHTTGP